MAIALTSNDLTLTATNQSIVMATNKAMIVTKGIVCNVDTTNRSITLYKVTAGGTAGTGNIIMDPSGASAFKIGPGTTLPLPISGLVLNPNDSIQGFATVTAVINISIGTATPS